MSKISVAKPLVILHGDEMAQVAFKRVLEQFVTSKLDIELLEIDLAPNSAYSVMVRLFITLLAP